MPLFVLFRFQGRQPTEQGDPGDRPLPRELQEEVQHPLPRRGAPAPVRHHRLRHGCKKILE